MVTGQERAPRVRLAEFGTPALPRIVERVMLLLLLGSMITFLVLLLPLLVLEEDAIELGREWNQMDALGRYGMGISFLLIIATILPMMGSNLWASWSVRRAIEAQAEDHPDLVACQPQLARDPDAMRRTLRIALWVFLGTFGTVGGFLFLMGLVSLANDVPESIEAVWIGGVVLVLALGCLTSLRALRRPLPSFSPRKTWSGDLSRVGRDAEFFADAQRSRPLPGWLRRLRTVVKVLAVAEYGLITITGFLTVIGVFARQGCRTCEPRSYGPGIEATIDRFWMLILAFAAVCAVTILVHHATGLICVVLTRRELLGRIDAGQADVARPDDAVLRDMVDEMAGPWGRVAHLTSLWTVGPLLLGVVWWLVGVVGHTVYVEYQIVGQTLLVIGLGLLAVTIIGVAVEETTDPAIRDRVRAAWPLDDRRPAGKG